MANVDLSGDSTMCCALVDEFCQWMNCRVGVVVSIECDGLSKVPAVVSVFQFHRQGGQVLFSKLPKKSCLVFVDEPGCVVFSKCHHACPC